MNGLNIFQEQSSQMTLLKYMYFLVTRGLLINQKIENILAQMFVLWYIKNASKAISVLKVSEGDYE